MTGDLEVGQFPQGPPLYRGPAAKRVGWSSHKCLLVFCKNILTLPEAQTLCCIHFVELQGVTCICGLRGRMTQGHACRTQFHPKSAPRLRILSFAPVCIRQVRSLGRQGLGDGKALLKRTERLVGPNQDERKEKLNKVDATERVCLR